MYLLHGKIKEAFFQVHLHSLKNRTRNVHEKLSRLQVKGPYNAGVPQNAGFASNCYDFC